MSQAIGPSKTLAIGTPLIARDGESIGTVKEIRNKFFKVDSPRHPDFWLSTGTISEAAKQQATLRITSDKVDQFERTEPMGEQSSDAIALLQEMHDEAKATFDQILHSAPGETSARLWKQLEAVLKVHEEMEDTYLYEPLAAERTAGSTLADWEEEHEEEVEDVELLINRVNQLDPADDRWRATMNQIRAKLTAHIEEEESDIFPRIRAAWDESRLIEAGENMSVLLQRRLPSHSPA